MIFSKNTAHSANIMSIAWSPDGHYLVTTSRDGSVIIWDLKVDDFHQLVSEVEKLNYICFSPDGSRLAIQGLAHDNSISIWDHKNMIKLDEFDGFLDNFRDSIWHYDGQMLAYQIDKKTVGIRKLSF